MKVATDSMTSALPSGCHSSGVDRFWELRRGIFSESLKSMKSKWLRINVQLKLNLIRPFASSVRFNYRTRWKAQI